MTEIENLLDPLIVARLGCLAMLTVLFLQSGLDKVVDRKGNLSWLKGHFKSSPFKNIVPLLLSIVTLVEVAAGMLSLAGIGFYLFGGDLLLGRIGASLSCLSILMLFTGQRIAKDYGGAASLIPYFILSIVTLLLTGDMLP